MRYYCKLALLLCLLCPALSKANLIKVDDRGDAAPSTGGTRTLRQAIALAANGDTVLIDTRGTITLNSNLTISKNIRIMGPYPIHSTIDVNGNSILATAITDTLHIYGVKITSSVNMSSAALLANAGSKVLLKDCVFKNLNNTSGNDGGALEVAGQVFVYNTSFISNTANSDGGAVAIHSGALGIFYNCTFYGNSASTGGAIINGEDARFVHCTFKDNNASSGKHIYAVSILLFSAHTEFQNCLFHQALTAGSELQGGLLGGWVSNGGNVYAFALGSLLTATPASDKPSTPVASIFLENTPIVDGYGLEYMRLTNWTSAAVENGVTSPMALPAKDARRAPRILYTTAAKPDAGAIEYTDYIVTSLSPVSPGGFQTQLNLIALSSNPGPYYVDFSFASLGSSSISGSGITKASVIIDGYNQQGSMVPGPGTVPGTVTAAIPGYTISGSTAGSTLLTVTGSGFKLNGIAFNTGSQTYNVSISGGNQHEIGGCIFSGGSSANLNLGNITGITIGGQFHHLRNIFNRSTDLISATSSSNLKIQGNFFGTNDLGTATMGSAATGINISGGSVTLIGGDYSRNRGNIMAGFAIAAISTATSTSGLHIYGNHIGLNYAGTGMLSSTGSGININTANGVYIGKKGAVYRNYICGSDPAAAGGWAGIGFMGTVSNAFILNNSIGIDRSGSAAANNTGISIVGGTGINIGDGTAQGRNIIGNSARYGIFLQGSTTNGTVINKNFIGVKENNLPAPNQQYGIYISFDPLNTTITNNIISNNVQYGVLMNGGGTNNIFTNNYIGTDTTGTVAMANGSGMWLSNTTTSGTLVTGNLLSGNTGFGVYISNTSNAILRNNNIGLNLAATAALPNGSGGINSNLSNSFTIGDASGGNIIAGNGGPGISLSNSTLYNMARNRIGTNASTATGLGNQGHGISLSGGADGSITDGNTIMYNNGTGVFVSAGSQRIEIAQNIISENTQLGISLNNLPITTPLPNDLNDADGPGMRGNAGQNYPVIENVLACTSTTGVSGTVNVDVADGVQSYRLDFYQVQGVGIDPSGHGEANIYLGSLTSVPTTNTFNFTYTHPSVLPMGASITATCSKNFSGRYATSEFSDTAIIRNNFAAVLNTLATITCNGGTTGSIQVIHNGVGPFTYAWYKNGSLQPALTTATVSSLGAGTYYCIVTTAGGCSVTTANLVLTEPAPVVRVITTTVETCLGDNDGEISIELVGGGTGNYDAVIYDAGSNAVASFVNIAAGNIVSKDELLPGNYGILVSDDNVCKDSAVVNISPSVNYVTASITTPPGICQGTTANFSGTSAGSPAVNSWSWSFGDGQTSTGLSTSSTYAGAGSFNVQLIVSNGTCSDTTVTTVTVDALPTVNAGTLPITCESAAAVSIPGSQSGATAVSWTSLTGGAITPTNSITPVYGPFTTAEVTNGLATAVVTAVNGACTVDDTITINIEKNPVLTLGADFTTCETSPVTLAPTTLANYGTLLWTGSGIGLFSAPTAASTNYDVSSDGGDMVTVTLTATSATGACASVSDNIDITVNEEPAVNAGTDYTVCYSNGSTNVPGASASNAASVSWTVLSGTGSLTGATTLTPTYTFGTGDEGTTVRLIVQANNAPCAPNADTINISIDAVPVAILGADMDECVESAVSLTAVSASGNLNWTGTGTGSFSTPSSASTNYDASGDGGTTVTVTLTATSLLGVCTAVSDNMDITVHLAPTISAGTNAAVCFSNGSYSFSGTAANHTSVNWTILSGTGTLAGTGTLNPVYTFGPGDEGNTVRIKADAQNTWCAISSDTIELTVDAVPVVNAGLDNSVCSGNVMNLSGTITNAGIQTWTSSGGGIFTNQFALTTGYTSGLTSGTDIITLTSTPNGTCAAVSNDMLLTVNTTPVANAGANVSICPGGSATLDGSLSTAAAVYSWEESAAVIATTASTTVSPVANTSYILTVNNIGCTDSDTVTVSIIVPGDASFSYSVTSFCPEHASELPAVMTAGGDFGVAGTTGISINTITGEISPALSTAGTYQVFHRLISPCLSTDTVSVTIFASPVVSLTAIPNDHALCVADTLNFTGTPSGGMYTAVTGLNTGTGIFAAGLGNIGSHSVEYTFTDANGCSANDTFNLVVNAPPVVSFTGLTGPYCPANGAVNLTGTPAGGNFFLNGTASTAVYDPTTIGTDSIAYFYQDPLTGCINYADETVVVNAGPATPILDTPAPYAFCESNPQNLEVTNPATTVNWYTDAAYTQLLATGNVISSDQLGNSSTVYVVNAVGVCISAPLPITYNHYRFNDITVGASYLTCAGTPVEIEVNVPAGSGILVEWEENASLDKTDSLKPVAKPMESSVYHVVMSHANMPSCTKNYQADVTVENCTLDNIANAFSPNGDGVNDTWKIKGILSHPNNKVIVFNRWGNILVQYQGYDNASVVWDGTFNNTLVAAGTYYYVIEYPDSNESSSGWVQVNY